MDANNKLEQLKAVDDFYVVKYYKVRNVVAREIADFLKQLESTDVSKKDIAVVARLHSLFEIDRRFALESGNFAALTKIGSMFLALHDKTPIEKKHVIMSNQNQQVLNLEEPASSE